MVRAHWIDIGGTSTGFGAGPRSPTLDRRAAARPAQDLRRGRARRKLYRVLMDNIRFPDPPSATCARRSPPAGWRRGAWTSCSTNTAATPFWRRSAPSSRRPSGSAATWWRRSPTASTRRTPRSTTTACARRAGADQRQGHGQGHVMTIDLSGCSPERKAGINSRTLAGAHVAYKALTAPLEPVNEGSFRALEVIIPEGNIMMARYPAPMAGWSALCRPWSIPSWPRSPRPCPTRCRPAITACSAARWCSSACIPRPAAASWCRAWKAAAGAAGPMRTASPARCRSARATCATAPSKASS